MSREKHILCMCMNDAKGAQTNGIFPMGGLMSGEDATITVAKGGGHISGGGRG